MCIVDMLVSLIFLIVYLQKFYIVYVCKRDTREIYRFHSIPNIL